VKYFDRGIEIDETLWYNIPIKRSTIKEQPMQTVSIRDLKNNPSNMTKYLENNESVFVTKHGKPIGITIPLNDDTLSMGIKKTVALEQYKQGLISMGKMAEIMGIDKQEAMQILNNLGLNWIEEDMDVIQSEVSKWL